MALKHFIQKIILPGGEADLNHLQEAALIEKADLSGPSLVLRFNDLDAIIKDEIGIRQFDEITLVYADILYRNAVNRQDKFIVLNHPESHQRILTLNCLEKTIFKATLPSKKARFFTGKTDLDVIKALLPAGKYDAKEGPVIEDHHILPGERPTNLLRRICRERGQLLFLRRGEVIYQPIEELYNRVEFDYHYRDTRKPEQIVDYRWLDNQEKVRDRLDRHFVGWSDTEGYIKADVKTEFGKEWTGFQSRYTLNKQHLLHEVVLDMLWDGHGGIRPGVAAKTTFRKLSAKPYKKLPTQVAFGNVTHWYRTNKYQCRAQGIIPQRKTNRKD